MTSPDNINPVHIEAMNILEKLGFRAPDKDEIRRANRERLVPGIESGFKKQAEFNLNFRRFFAQPEITYSSISHKTYLGIAGVRESSRLSSGAWFFLSPTWTIEDSSMVQQIRTAIVAQRISYPDRKFIILTNTQEEADLVRASGEAAFFLNKNAFISQDDFKPLPDITPEYSAIYNAQLTKWKRHELSLGIEKCSFIYYRSQRTKQYIKQEQAILARHAEEAPGHRFLNVLDPEGAPTSFLGWEVNKHLNNASVGLCLSEKEGAMLASIEYMLAGLPVVSTPSKGGRSVYFKDDYSIVTDADQNSIAQAVEALKSRNISREYIAQNTRDLLNKDRDRFRELMQSILDIEQADTVLEENWPVMDMSHDYWSSASTAIRDLLGGKFDVPGGSHTRSETVKDKPAKKSKQQETKASERPLLTLFQMGYNQGDNIEESLKAVLAQSYSPLEIVFSDDCSSDNTFEVMQRVADEYDGPHKIILNRNPQNLGIIGNVNRSVELSNGKLLIQANGDDISLPDRVEKLYQAWSEDPENIMLLYSEGYRIDMDGNLIGLPSTTPLVNLQVSPALIAKHNIWVAGSMVAFSPEIFKKFGQLERPASVEDHVIPFRAVRLGKIVRVDERLVRWRSEGTSWVDARDTKDPYHHYYGIIATRMQRELNNQKSFLKEYKKDNFEDCEECTKHSKDIIHLREFTIATAASSQLRLFVRIPLVLALFIMRRDKKYLSVHLRYLLRMAPYYQKIRRHKRYLKQIG